MKPPCITIVKYLLPAIRALVTKDLIEKYNMRKIDASEKMELTPAAVTQYFKGKRGDMLAREMLQHPEVMEMISELAMIVAEKNIEPSTVIKKLCEICTSIRNKGIICKLHQEDMPSIVECSICQP